MTSPAKKTPTNICEECSKGHWVRPYRRAKAKYCSKSCAGTAHARKYLNDGNPKTHLIGNQFRKGKRPANSFENGHEPWNKGIKGIHLNPETEFIKSQDGLNWVPVGTEVLRADGRYWVKIEEPSSWQYRSRVVWERHNGPIPDGFIVHHKDHTKTNDSIENLEAMSRADHIEEHRHEFAGTRHAG